MKYAEQIVPGDEGVCQYCGRTDLPLQRHEVFHGPYRDRSKALGCWVNLCYVCHTKLHQHDPSIDKALKIWMQANAMEHYGWTVEQFRHHFGKNYLEDI